MGQAVGSWAEAEALRRYMRGLLGGAVVSKNMRRCGLALSSDGRQARSVRWVVGYRGSRIIDRICCKNVLCCPWCARRRAADMAEVDRRVLIADLEAGWQVYYGVLTVRHSADDDLATLSSGVRRAWSDAFTGRREGRKPADDLRLAGVVAWKRYYDLTINRHMYGSASDTGWHPHFNYFLVVNPESDVAAVRRHMIDSWRDSVWRILRSAVSDDAQFMVRIYGLEDLVGVTDYVYKGNTLGGEGWDAALEAVGAVWKTRGGLNQFGLLRLAMTAEDAGVKKAAGREWRRMAEALYRVRAYQSSGRWGLEALANRLLEAEDLKDDGQGDESWNLILAKADDEVVAFMVRSEYFNKNEAAIVGIDSAANDRKWEAVDDFRDFVRGSFREAGLDVGELVVPEAGEAEAEVSLCYCVDDGDVDWSEVEGYSAGPCRACGGIRFR